MPSDEFLHGRPAASPAWTFDDEPGPSATAAPAGGERPPDPPRGPAGHEPPSRSAVVRRVALAAVIAVVAVTVCALVARPVRGTSRSAVNVTVPSGVMSASPARSGLPSSTVAHALPGSRVLGEYYGSGSTTLSGGDHKLGPGRSLVLRGACSGPGGATVGPVTVAHCDARPVGAALTEAQARSLLVRAAGSTTWRLALVDEPAHGTDGSLQFPVNPLLTSALPTEVAAAASGSGSAHVPLASASTWQRVEDVRLILTCSGSGVSLSSADHLFDGHYTRTCFRGWSYEFDVPGVLLPGTLDVDASPRTSWRLAVIRA